ncbi:MAG TPA: NUDIX domain-containing protein [Candidatus Acidoferrum sp.]|nr:NUDIX domain-containing protein [Candidatus Acidoferrum sp.]
MDKNITPKVGVGVIVFRDIDGKPHVMMHQRRGEHAEGYWGTGGGHLEVGESLQAGALRELREEAGEDLAVGDVKLIGIVNFTEMKPKHFVDITFSCAWVSGEPTNSSPEETTDWQWVPLDNLPKPLFPPVIRQLELLRTGQAMSDSAF